MPEYTLLAGGLAVVTVAVELLVLRTGLFRSLQYWLSMVIVVGFQIPVDGFLTRLDSPVVIYAHREILGVRWPWDIPIEDFVFGFALVTLAIALWRRRTGTVGQEPVTTPSMHQESPS